MGVDEGNLQVNNVSPLTEWMLRNLGGERGYDDSVPGEVTKTTSSEDRTT